MLWRSIICTRGIDRLFCHVTDDITTVVNRIRVMKRSTTLVIEKYYTFSDVLLCTSCIDVSCTDVY